MTSYSGEPRNLWRPLYAVHNM